MNIEWPTNKGVLFEELAWVIPPLEWLVALITLCAIGILLLGAARFVTGGIAAEITRTPIDRVKKTNEKRLELGRYILASLELFIVADLIHAALSQELAILIHLAILVLIRSAISFFLDREMTHLQRELGE